MHLRALPESTTKRRTDPLTPEAFRLVNFLELNEAIVVPFGSRVYGTNRPDSDYDFIVISPGQILLPGEYSRPGADFLAFSFKGFKEALDKHEVHALEAYFHPNGKVRKRFNLKLNLARLRKQISGKASNSFVKAKKKINKENDFLIGWKSLFHSLRILDLGYQIATAEKPEDVNLSAANHYWIDILAMSTNEWEPLRKKYKPEYNKLATKFRKAAPKKVKAPKKASTSGDST